MNFDDAAMGDGADMGLTLSLEHQLGSFSGDFSAIGGANGDDLYLVDGLMQGSGQFSLDMLQARNEAQRGELLGDLGLLGGPGTDMFDVSGDQVLGENSRFLEQQQFQQHQPRQQQQQQPYQQQQQQQSQHPYQQQQQAFPSLFGSTSPTAATSGAASPLFSGSGSGTLQPLGGASYPVKAEDSVSILAAAGGDARALLDNLIQEQVKLGQHIAEVYQNQRLALRGHQPGQQAASASAHAELVSSAGELPRIQTQLDNLVRTLEQCFSSVVLEPAELQKVFFLRQDLFIQHRQVNLLMQELQWWQYTEQKAASAGSDGLSLQRGQSKTPCLCELVVVKQPFPFIINKNKQLNEDDLQVQLLTASATPVASVTPVRCALTAEAGNVTKGTNVGKALDADTSNIDPATRVAKFPIKFCSGTKKLPAQVKFGMQVTLMSPDNPQPYPVESHFSQPFVVITNECQWDGSAGVLMKRDVFPDGRVEVRWPAFANVLQRHFCLATRQELAHPQRILSFQDIEFIHSKFFRGAAVVATRDFDHFWSWFGPTMQRIRYQRHMCGLWQQGFVYGFMTRDQANAALEGQEPGTFIIRFSERNAGQYVIAYVGGQVGVLKNYLVQPNDTAAAKRTLPDFIMEQPQFQHLLVLGYNDINEPVFWRLSKSEAFSQFVGKSSAPRLEEGYDPL